MAYSNSLQEMVHVFRGDLPERIHLGSACLVDSEGAVIQSVGDYNYITYSRSTSKPFQALEVILSGSLDRFNFTQEELALMCSSHFGEEQHVMVLESILCKIGITEQALQCPQTYSRNTAVRTEQLKKGLPPRKAYSDCSGKHAGMIASCIANGWDYSEYLDRNHPLQKRTAELLSVMYETPVNKLCVGVDGCGVPVFSSSVKNMAQAYCHLVTGSGTWNQQIDDALCVIRDAMMAYPDMLAGTGGLCSILTKYLAPEGLAKVGADGVHCSGFIVNGRAYGLALKIADGNYDASKFAVCAILEKLGLLSKTMPHELIAIVKRKLLNEHKSPVGDFVLACDNQIQSIT
ncbi:MAG TPA: asparaginase [Spirochaetales bacterium]|nr:asparaginase [Spirochaetales bacterium]